MGGPQLRQHRGVIEDLVGGVRVVAELERVATLAGGGSEGAGAAGAAGPRKMPSLFGGHSRGGTRTRDPGIMSAVL